MFDPHAVLAHHSKPVPRYTSYPTAPQFKDGAGSQLFSRGIKQLDEDEPVSAYLHIPFCDRLCWFCGCHTKHTLKYEPISRYMQTLTQELRLFADHVGFRPRLGQLHLGGGSPSLLKRDDLTMLREALETAFQLDSQTEISIEIDPSDVDSKSIDALVEFGLSRASVGVQDFHPDVQKAINRPQSYEITRDVISLLRNAGIQSVNIDALYGLPLQSELRLLDTIEKCLEMRPDRLALFGYAHVPWLKKHQNLIKQEDLPGSIERFDQAQAASAFLVKSGYQSIGIDHFALPDDSLARAAKTGKLHRNFQGYTTDDHPTLIGFGASSIGRFYEGYVQNTVPTSQYQQQVGAGAFPKNKGQVFTDEDRLRSHIIERLMCDFEIDFGRLGHFAENKIENCLRIAKIAASRDALGLCQMHGTTLTIPKQARPFTRIVAAQFDEYLNSDGFQYSKAV